MGQSNVHVYEFGRGETRVTPPGKNMMPIWSPDGQTLFFMSERDAIQTVFSVQPDSKRDPLQISDGKVPTILQGITPNGKELIVRQGDKYVLMPAVPGDPQSSHEPKPIPAEKQIRWNWLFSPNGRYLITTSIRNDRWEVVMDNYPAFDKQWPISLNGGEEPRLNPNGREIIFRWGGQWWGTEVSFEPELKIGTPHIVFDGPYINVLGYSWDISHDGQRFLLLESPEQNKPVTHLMVITNFFDEVKRRLRKN